MCELFGVWKPTETATSHVSKSFERMLDESTRDRSDYATWHINNGSCIGHICTKLSAVDRNHIIFDATTGCSLTYDGSFFACDGIESSKIYSNARQLLDDYIEYGVDCFRTVNAEFSAIIFDARSNCAYLIRDRWGTRPLYYLCHNSSAYIASDVKTILSLSSIQPKFSKYYVIGSLLRFDFLSLTPFENIFSVPPGSILRIAKDMSTKVVSRAEDLSDWMQEGATCLRSNIDEVSETMSELLLQSVERRLVKPHVTGIPLSGGLDSSLVLSMAKRSGWQGSTFTIGFNDKRYDETEWAKIAARSTNSQHYVFKVSEKEQLIHFSEAIFRAEHPVQLTDGAGKVYATQLLPDGIQRYLVGEGADEIFLGYPSHLHAAFNFFGDKRFKERTTKHTTRIGLDDVGDVSSTIDIPPYISASNQVRQSLRILPFVMRILDCEMQKQLDIKEYILQYADDGGFNEGFTPIQSEQLAACRLTIPNYLFTYLGGKIDRVSGIESSYPFLDADLVKYASSVSATLLLHDGKEKGLLRHISNRWIDQRLVQRPKHGYSAPILPTAVSRAIIENRVDVVKQSKIDELEIFNSQAVWDLFAALTRGGRYGDEDRVMKERLATFVISLVLLNEMFIRGNWDIRCDWLGDDIW